MRRIYSNHEIKRKKYTVCRHRAPVWFPELFFVVLRKLNNGQCVEGLQKKAGEHKHINFNWLNCLELG